MSQTPPQQVIDQFVGSAHGDLATIRHLLQEFPSIVNLPASWGEYAIQAAAQTGQVEIAEMLLAHGAPLDICTASMLGRLDTITQMLDADPTLARATGAHNLPVLYHAAIRGNIPMAEALLARGSDIDAGRGKTTALHGAAMFGQAQMASWLLAHGADADALDYQGLTALGLARKMGRSEVVSVLETRATPS